MLLHHPLHTLGDNINPSLTDPVRTEERDAEGNLTMVRYGLEPILPTVRPLLDASGAPQPFVASDEVTVFTILDTGTCTLTSYAFDTRTPDTPATVLDRFTLG